MRKLTCWVIRAINVLVTIALIVTSVAAEPAQARPVLLAQQQSGAWQYPLPDGPSASLRAGLGSVRQWVDASRQMTYAARYAPFGGLLWQQGTAPGPWGFAAEMQDPTGLIYLRARWYDPATGRFLTRDPVPGVPSLPASLNPYVYALNNPVLYTDLSGEFVPLLLLGALIGGGLAAYDFAMVECSLCLGEDLQSGRGQFEDGQQVLEEVSPL